MRKTLFSHIINQEIAFFDKTRTGELTSRLSSDTQVRLPAPWPPAGGGRGEGGDARH